MYGFIVSAALISYFAFPNFLLKSGCWPLGWLALVFLFPVLENKNPIQRCVAGGLYGLVFYGLLVHWFISYSLIGFVFFVLALSLQPLLFGLGYGWRPAQPVRQVFYVAGLWVGSEYARTVLMSGFAWNLAHSQSFNPAMIQVSALTGSWGLSFILVACNFCFYRYFIRHEKPYLLTAVLLLGGLFLFGQARFLWDQCDKQFKSSVNVLAVQPNIDFRQKNDIVFLKPVIGESMALTFQGLAHDEADLIVWPETAVPVDYRRHILLFSRLMAAIKVPGSYFLFGTALNDQDQDYNSAVLLDNAAVPQGRYDKRYLVPFSEFLPPGTFWNKAREWLKIRSYDFSPGGKGSLFKIRPGVGDQDFVFRFGALICSEDALGFLYRQYKARGAGMVIVLLNDGWFARPEALMLHAQNAVMHAAENRLPVLRVANSGWTGLIDSFGRIAHPDQVPLQQPAFGRFQIQPDNHKTVYALCGDWFCYLCLAFVIIDLIHRRKN